MNQIAIRLLWVIGLLAVLPGIGLKLYAQTPVVNLTTHQSTVSPPASATLEWHSALPVSITNLITGAQTTSAAPGIYYAVYNYGGSPVCYSQPSYLRILTNTCPAKTVDLMTAVDPASTPVNTTVTFHSSATASAASEVPGSTVTASATETVYYVAYKTFNAATNSYCYSDTSPIVVVLSTCCPANVVPALSATSKQNLCPATTIDLSTMTASNAPVSSTLSWHTGTPATAANKLSSVTGVAAGTYYAAFTGTDSGTVCFGPTTAFSAVSTTCAPPCSATVAPTLSAVSVFNSCPDKTISLAGITAVGLPANTTLSWHNSATATAANALTSLTGLGAGTYYAALKGAACYGPTVAVVASVTNCDTVLPPVPPSTTACDYATPPASVTFAVASAPAGYSVTYLLVDRVTGAIVQTNASATSFSSVGQGTYLITAAWYKGTLVNAAPGKLISTVYENESGCLKFSDWLSVRVCSPACDVQTIPATLTFTSAPSPTTGVTTTYVLVDEVTNLIVATSQVNSFANVAKGDYAIAAVYYTGSLTLTPGTSLYDVTTNNDNCQAVSNAIRLRVCICPANVVPVLSATTKQNICPAITADLSTITATNAPLSTTLTWHSATPASVITEITSVSSVTAGTYYAAFKGINSGSACYGPTTAVVVSLTICQQAPIARNDINYTNVNTPVPGNVLTNDVDPQGLPLSVSVTPACQPSSGTVVISSNGNYVFTPATGFVGSVSFCYQVCNSANICSNAVVTVNVLPVPVVGQNNPPVANNDNTQTRQGVPVTIDVAANDTDPDSNTSGNGQLGAPTLIGPALNTSVGSATVVNGKVVFTPSASFTGVVSFPYQICDLGSNPGPLRSTAVVTVTVLPTPPVGTTLAPVAVDDALLTQVNTPKGGSLATNDSDPNTPPLPLTYTAGSFTMAHGTIVVAANGSYTYTPANNYSGPDSYTYSVCNTAGKCANATLNILVQSPLVQAPIAKNDINNTNKGTPVPGNVLTNDVDPQGLPLTVNVVPVCAPSSGTVVLTANGSYTYVPTATFAGSVSFCYQVCNSAGVCATAVVTVNVNEVPVVGQNNAPIANNDNTQTRQGVPVTIDVAANDTDPDSNTSGNGQLGAPTLIGPALNASVGSATVVNGKVVFTPSASFTGVVSFPYQICDQGSNPGPLCSTAVVTVTVLPTPPVGTTLAPVAVDDALLTQVNTPKGGSLATNDSDPNTPPLPLTYTAGSFTTAYGTIVVAVNGSYTYTPANNYVGPDSYTYSVCNTAGKCANATLNILVQSPLVQAPIAKNDINNTNKGTPVPGNVLTNDVDPQGLPLTVNVVPVCAPSSGTVVLTANGSYTYVPTATFVGSVSFCYQVCNSAGVCATAVVTVNVNDVPVVGQNNPPVANNDNTQTRQGVPVTIDVAANDTDPDSNTSGNGQLGAPTLIGPALNASVGSATVVNGKVVFTPSASFTGVVSFPYQICDLGNPAKCDTAVVTVTVLPTPPPNTTLAPVAVDDALLTQVNTPKGGSLATNDSDPNTPPLPLTYTAGSFTTAYGTIVVAVNGSYTYTPANNYVGPDSYTYSVCNTAGKCANATLSINVQNPGGLKLLPKAWLQGALFSVTAVNGIMRDDLRVKNLIPSTSPYASFTALKALTTVGAITNTTAVFSVTGTNAIVDWVFVELRSPSNMSLVVDSRPALIQRDGDIVDVDGVSPVMFNNASAGNYYVSVRHRNHLGVMTATAIPLSVTGSVVDFRDPNTPTYRKAITAINQSQVTVAQGVAMWAGNTSGDNVVLYQGATLAGGSNDVAVISNQVKGSLLNILGSSFYVLRGYFTGDVNMDGETRFQGGDTDVNYIYQNIIKNHPGNIAGQNNFTIIEQLP